jgi:hypothetical protein
MCFINPFQSNFSATRILPSSYLFWAGKRLVDYCNYPTVLKEKNINRNIKSTTCAICWLKSVLHEEKRREQENHNVGLQYAGGRKIGLERVKDQEKRREQENHNVGRGPT